MLFSFLCLPLVTPEGITLKSDTKDPREKSRITLREADASQTESKRENYSWVEGENKGNTGSGVEKKKEERNEEEKMSSVLRFNSYIWV